MELRSVVGEYYLKLLCRVLSRPLESPLTARWLYGAGLFPRSCVRPVNRWGMNLTLDLHDQVSRMLYFLGSHEAEEMRLISSSLRPDSVALDICAHVGGYSLFMAHLLDPARGRVYSFEPDPRNFARLQHHCKANNLCHVTPIPRAMGAAGGTVDFFLAPSKNSGMSSLMARGQEYTRTTVTVTTIDDFVRQAGLQRLDFIKMDAEGFEGDILRGGRETFLQHHPAMLMELNGTALARRDSTCGDIIRLLHEMGYAVRHADAAGAEVRPDELGPDGFANVYCR